MFTRSEIKLYEQAIKILNKKQICTYTNTNKSFLILAHLVLLQLIENICAIKFILISVNCNINGL